MIIVGGGPAGLTAGIYATRAGLKTVLLEKVSPGGQIINSEWVENYPGFPNGISGFELGQLMEQQAVKHGLAIEFVEATGIELQGNARAVKTSSGDFVADAVIIAGGAEHARLGIPGEEKMVGKGLSYCATCDGPFFRGKIVAVIGGGDVALTDALYLSRLASKISVIHRRSELRASKVLQARAFAEPKIEFIWETVVDAIEGDGNVRGLRLRNVKTQATSDLKLDGVFMAVGTKPNTGYLGAILKLAPDGSIPVNAQMETEVPGIFAAGDIRQGSIRQVVAAAGDGAVAAMAAERFLTQR
ncbi:MAG: thioredoxin-disulfide reductase [Chloroflexi bacterium]|nr:thioredoxin-disulfide reductase [Chloroflexota bacterium]